LNQPSTDDTV